MNINIDLSKSGIDNEAIASRRMDSVAEYDRLGTGDIADTGWFNWPLRIEEDLLFEIKNAAEKIQSESEFFLVLGIGGSYMGAKAVLDLLAPSDAATKVLFAGINFSGRHYNEIFDIIGDSDYSICVISKSGSTAETKAAFAIAKEKLEEKYGPSEASARTYVISDLDSPLWNEGSEAGYTLFQMPPQVGGRYSVFTPVGLLPIAAGGVDIVRLIAGAGEVAEEFEAGSENTGPDCRLFDYAIARQAHYDRGKTIEVFEFFDPYFDYTGEWLKQLFGESEGKEGKGLFPASLIFSRDLHSMGQFLQQGTPCFFETMVTADRESVSVRIPESAGELYGGKSLDDINRCAVEGVKDAHIGAGVPVISITIPSIDTETVGGLLYWFCVQCAVSALLSGVNPFDQPGVEDYKSNMRKHISEL